MNQTDKNNPLNRSRLSKHSIKTGLIILLFIGGLFLLYLFSDSERHRSENAISDASNLVVLSDPDKCVIIINGEEVGVTNNKKLELDIEPNKMHKLQATKEGYETYESVVWGKKAGFYKTEISLVKIIGETPFISSPPRSGRKGQKKGNSRQPQTPSRLQEQEEQNSASPRKTVGFMGRFDHNNDEKISADEYFTDFAKMDRNGDDVISLDECPPDNMQKFLNKHDNNSDEQITKDEFFIDFSEKDGNGDGFLSSNEIP